MIWLSMRVGTDPRESSSFWINKNVSRNATIGIENIPIYQMLPDIILKEYYEGKYMQTTRNKYNYIVVDSKTKEFPEYVVVSNAIEKKITINSDKKSLIERLELENYKLVSNFKPNLKYSTLIAKEKELYLSSLMIIPNSISLYYKPK